MEELTIMTTANKMFKYNELFFWKNARRMDTTGS